LFSLSPTKVKLFFNNKGKEMKKLREVTVFVWDDWSLETLTEMFDDVWLVVDFLKNDINTIIITAITMMEIMIIVFFVRLSITSLTFNYLTIPYK